MKRRIRVEFASAIFASLLFVLMVGIADIFEPEQLGPAEPPDSYPRDSAEATPPVVALEETDCEQAETEFAAKLSHSRSCLVDADCTLARFECPFECVSSVSASIIDELKREEQSFLEACHRCAASCPDTLVKWRAACVRQRCIVLDSAIDELQEETLRHIAE